MMMGYNIFMNLFWVFFLFLLPVICLVSKKRRETLLFRSGLLTGWVRKNSNKRRIWIHALSVGEVRSAIPLVKALKDHHETPEIVFTVSTKTGFETAGRHFFTPDRNMVDQLGYFPLDFSYCVKKITTLVAPDAVIIVETDIWPNFLNEMKKKNIPVVLVNARLSETSLKGYLFFKTFFSTVFSVFARIMVQTPLDAERFQCLEIKKEKIQVAGNMKFEKIHENRDESFVRDMRKRMGIQKNTSVLLAGSTHEGEETLLCRVFKALKIKYPGLMMILAPRDPSRCRTLLSSMVSKGGCGAVMMSELKDSSQAHEVILVDEMGVLSQLYELCHVAYIGGSLVKQGGHNPLEAAAFAKPILFGPDMSDFVLISKLLTEGGGARQIESEPELIKELDILLGHPQIQNQRGQLNHGVFKNHSGAVEQIVRNLEELGIV